MSEALLYLDPASGLNLQAQIRQKLVEGILSGAFPPGSRMPSSRKLAAQLGVARNTVVLAYDQLLGENLLESRERSGIFVAPNVLAGRVGLHEMPVAKVAMDSRLRRKVRLEAPMQQSFRWPANWQQHPFPFIDGHFDSALYPTAQWREAGRLALGAGIVRDGSVTEGDSDDPALLEEIRTKMLPRRGITARPDEILITLGEQNALFLLTQLLTDPSVCVLMEDPGNPRMRALLALRGAQLLYQPVDENGMVISQRLEQADLVYVTPSHQVPTAATMAMQRRQALLKRARESDQLIIEDDFEHESNFLGQPHPSLRSMDSDNRVIYVSALPKVLAPGLRIGFIVASADLIQEARRLRQLVIGRPSLLNQRTAALFLSLGHYDALMARLHHEISRRWIALRDALNHYRPNFTTMPNRGGSVFWVQCPDGIDVETLTLEAAKRGILIEPDTHYYAGPRPGPGRFRMGVTAIPADRIREGVRLLRELIWELGSEEAELLDPGDTHLLRGGAIAAAMAGSTWLYKTVYGDPATFELYPEGRMTGRAGHADEERDEGRWWVEGDYWCRQWNNWAYGETGRYYLVLKDHQLRLYTTARRFVDSAVVQRGDA